MATRRTAKCRLTRGGSGAGSRAVTRALVPRARFIAFPRFSIARQFASRRGPTDRSIARPPVRPSVHPSVFVSPSLSFFHLFASPPVTPPGQTNDGERTLLARARFAERRAAAVRVVHDKPLLGSDGSWLALSLPPSSLCLRSSPRPHLRLPSLACSLTRSFVRSFVCSFVRPFVHTFVRSFVG